VARRSTYNCNSREYKSFVNIWLKHITANFLKNYYESMQLIRNGNEEVDRKGKKALGNIIPVQEKKVQEKDFSIWEKPSEGRIKVNVDASFLPDRMSDS
jgi:hypothetical protein